MSYFQKLIFSVLSPFPAETMCVYVFYPRTHRLKFLFYLRFVLLHHKCLFHICKLTILFVSLLFLLLLQVLDFRGCCETVIFVHLFFFCRATICSIIPAAWILAKRTICKSLCGCLWPLQSASVYIHWFNVCSGAAVQREALEVSAILLSIHSDTL